MKIADLRAEYSKAELDEASTDPDPIAQFSRWWDEVTNSDIRDANAMTLATADAAGRPSARTVLLKGFDAEGFVFYTNYDSRKGRELAANPQASLLFFWKELERQVRVDGRVERVSAAESDAYFRSRPLASRIGAWASPQSEVISGKTWLLARAAEMGLRHGPSPARPPHWGGYRVMPDTIEFWQGRPSRLHDRLRYRRVDSGRGDDRRADDGQETHGWVRERLAP